MTEHIPYLNLGLRETYRHIDFLREKDLPAPIMWGYDCHGRFFFALHNQVPDYEWDPGMDFTLWIDTIVVFESYTGLVVPQWRVWGPFASYLGVQEWQCVNEMARLQYGELLKRRSFLRMSSDYHDLVIRTS